MFRKYSSLLALLIFTNIIICECDLNFRRNAILFAAAFTIISITLLPKIKSLITSCFNDCFTSSPSSTPYISQTIDNALLVNNELVLNCTETSDQNYSELPLIKASGIIQQLPLVPVEHVKIFGKIAIIHINDAEDSRIEIDESFANNLIFSVVNGVLTVTTPDEQPRKFEYNGNSLCKIYAKLLTHKLIASNGSDIHIVEQKLNNIISTFYSNISGSIKHTADLNLACSQGAHLKLTNINCENLIAKCFDFGKMIIDGTVRNTQTITIKDYSHYNSSLLQTSPIINIEASNFAHVTINNVQSDTLSIELRDHSQSTIQGSTKQPTIIVSNFSTFNGSNLIGRDGCLNAKASKNSKISVAGNITDAKLAADNFSSINAPQLNANTAIIAIDSHSKVTCGTITTTLSGYVNNFSTMSHTGTPWVKVTLNNHSKCTSE